MTNEFRSSSPHKLRRDDISKSGGKHRGIEPFMEYIVYENLTVHNTNYNEIIT